MSGRSARCARAVIEYDGTAFAGSQVQPNARTVQGELEEALNRLTGERVRIATRRAHRCRGARHRPGRSASACRDGDGEGATSWPELRRRLNAVLPADLAVRSLRAAPVGFDPRRDAVPRVYRYRIRMRGRARPTGTASDARDRRPAGRGGDAAAAAARSPVSATSRPWGATCTAGRSVTCRRWRSVAAGTSSRSA